MLTIHQRSITYRKPREVQEFHKGSWVRLEDPTDAELESAATMLALDLPTLRDALDPYETPRIESEPEGIYVFMRHPQGEGTAPLLAVITNDGFLTITKNKSPLIDKFLEGRIDFYTTQKAKFLLLILTETNARFTQSLANIRKEVNRKRTRPDKMNEKDIVAFVGYESTLNDYLDSFIPQQGVLNRILSLKIDVHEDDKDLIEDLILSTNQLIETSRSAIKTMVNIRGAYTAISTERLNQVIRRLTALTVILAVPTVITGFFGMNVMLPIGEYPQGGLIIGGVLLIIAALMIGLFSKNRWL